MVPLQLDEQEQQNMLRAMADSLYAEANVFTAEGGELLTVSDKLHAEANKRYVRANELRAHANELYSEATKRDNNLVVETQDNSTTGQQSTTDENLDEILDTAYDRELGDPPN